MTVNDKFVKNLETVSLFLYQKIVGLGSRTSFSDNQAAGFTATPIICLYNIIKISMENKKVYIPLIIILFLIAIYVHSNLDMNPQYKSTQAPDISGNNIKSIVTSLVGTQEDFVGSIEVKKTIDTKGERAEIIMTNNYTGDDSITSIQYKTTLELKNSIWVIIDHQRRWKCARGSLPNKWTTNSCI